MLEKFKTLINTLPLDKIVHFLIGALIAAMLIPFGFKLAIAAVFVAAFGKEFLDYAMGKEFDYMDFIWTVVGGLLFVIYSIKLVPLFLA